MCHVCQRVDPCDAGYEEADRAHELQKLLEDEVREARGASQRLLEKLGERR